tara:strand:- start:321 stop:842 length:522 start_codon:yes stop_codon:yes gene_type:complete
MAVIADPLDSSSSVCGCGFDDGFDVGLGVGLGVGVGVVVVVGVNVDVDVDEAGVGRDFVVAANGVLPLLLLLLLLLLRFKELRFKFFFGGGLGSELVLGGPAALSWAIFRLHMSTSGSSLAADIELLFSSSAMRCKEAPTLLITACASAMTAESAPRLAIFSRCFCKKIIGSS